jgi:SNF family Na+-dependent transporter
VELISVVTKEAVICGDYLPNTNASFQNSIKAMSLKLCFGLVFACIVFNLLRTSQADRVQSGVTLHNLCIKHKANQNIFKKALNKAFLC